MDGFIRPLNAGFGGLIAALIPQGKRIEEKNAHSDLEAVSFLYSHFAPAHVIMDERCPEDEGGNLDWDAPLVKRILITGHPG